MKVSVHKGRSPKGFDLVFSSTNEHGTSGQLNEYVLAELGGGLLPSREVLSNGFTHMKSNSGSIVCYIVTIVDGNANAKGRLLTNLSKAFRARRNGIAGRKVWIPLLGAGLAGLSFRESFDEFQLYVVI